MSCNCDHNSGSSPFVCACDNFVFPQVLSIDAGLTDLPRQTGTFSQFRQAMLYDIRAEGIPLLAWRARGNDDLGVMLIEMWAYVCDVISFYDKVIANEEYLSTASRSASLRKLVALLGYIPKPAVAASVQLIALADGRLPVTLPQGTAFRSGAFNGNPPQVFELTSDTQINPLANSWKVLYPHWQTIQSGDPGNALNIIPSIAPKEKTLLLLSTPNDVQTQVVQVANIQPMVDLDGRKYSNLIFTAALNLASGTPFSFLQLMISTRTAKILQIESDTSTIDLDGIYNDLQAGDYIFISSGIEVRWFKILSVSINQITQQNSISVTQGSSAQSYQVSGPAINVMSLELDESIDTNTRSSFPFPKDNYQRNSLNDFIKKTYLYDYHLVPGIGTNLPPYATRELIPIANWSTNSALHLQVYFGLRSSGTVTGLSIDALNNTNNVPVALSQVDSNSTVAYPANFLFQDNNSQALVLNGQIDDTKDTIILGTNNNWLDSTSMVLPVTAYGNLITATRGQTVLNEIIGNGDAASPNQTFILKNSPLTYLANPSEDNPQGISSTLSVYVDNIRWKEVPNFYGTLPSDQIYIVRQDDSGNSYITFGDGIRGRRLSTGTNNIMASYRFGAGSARPPSGLVNQIAKPFKGLRSVTNPTAAWGGGDADSPQMLRTNAPASALILGRAVSILDMEAVAASVSGVEAVQAQWNWQSDAQCTLVQIWYAGQDNLAPIITQQIMSVSDPTLIVQVFEATPIPATISIQVEIDGRYFANLVLPQVTQALLDLLDPANMGIGNPLFRSQIFKTCLSVEGVTVVDALAFYPPLTDYGLPPGSGNYFELKSGSISINGQTF